jgi:uncharacterized protein (TIGR02145 family)
MLYQSLPSSLRFGLFMIVAYAISLAVTPDDSNATTSGISVSDRSITESKPSIIRDTKTVVVDVLNPKTGRTWMDRNLGASRAATSPNDPEAYGDLYQWGRKADGHQRRNSTTSSMLISSDSPNVSAFIVSQSRPYDWSSTGNSTLWQGVNGNNNPCPVGYRLPTEQEWTEEIGSWRSRNIDGGFASVLKLTAAGRRSHSNSALSMEGLVGTYWSSTTSASSAIALAFSHNTAEVSTSIGRASGYTVRCIKDAVEPAKTTDSTPKNPAVETRSTPQPAVSTPTRAPDPTPPPPATNTAPLVTTSELTQPTTTPKTPIAGRDNETTVVDVTNSVTGRTWMDRNLGASRAATSPTDAEAFGDLYQWGRATDGHQKRNSPKKSSTSNTASPGSNDFILSASSPYDWLSPKSDNLWRGEAGANNPCPVGYRIPTEAEWNQERATWRGGNAAGAFGSPLKLPMAGYRVNSSGSLFNVGSVGSYWSSTTTGTEAARFGFNSSNANSGTSYRAFGNSVRCIKD